MNVVACLALATLAAVTSSTASAQFRKPEDAIKYRQSVMTVQGRAFYGTLGGMSNGRIPYDPKAAADAADLVVMLSRLPWAAFGPGTDKGAVTDAKPAVWTEQARFKEQADKMQSEVVKLAAAAKTGSLDSLKPAYAAARETCKACHDVFTSQ